MASPGSAKSGILPGRGVLISLAAIILLAGWFAASGEDDRASLEGTVTDADGVAISDVRVEIVRLPTQDVIQLATDRKGCYAALSLPPGQYRIMVSKKGYRGVRREPVRLSPRHRVRLDFLLVAETSLRAAPQPGANVLLRVHSESRVNGL